MPFCNLIHPPMPRRSLIDAVVPHVPENEVEPGFSWQTRNTNTLVMRTPSGYGIEILIPFYIQDFLSVRKIPVKGHGRLDEHGVAASSDDEPEAQTVSTYLTTIRKHLLRDRALHDMVCPLAFKKKNLSYTSRLIPECRQRRLLSHSFGLIVNTRPLIYSD